MRGLLAGMLWWGAAAVSGQGASIPRMTWEAAPQPYQVVPRDPATQTGRVLLAGRVHGRRFERIRLRVKRGGRTLWLTSMPLDRAHGGAFRLADRLRADGWGYTLEVELVDGDRAIPVLRVPQVVVGDAILVQGGTNAEARQTAGSAGGQWHPLLRSFGARTADPARAASDQTWRPAEGDAAEGAGAVGQWALCMGRFLVDHYGIPMAVLSGAAADLPPEGFLPRADAPGDLGTNYGRLLSRARRAGVAEHARLLIWYPDEVEGMDAESVDRSFRALRRAWLRDYPALERIYVVQTRPGCGRDPGDVAQRERQRRWGEEFPEVTVLSTTGLRSHDGCQFAYTAGYADLGLQLGRLWARDGLGDDRFAAVEPPRPVRAWAPAPDGREIMVEMQSPEQQLSWEPGAEAHFRLEGSAAEVIGGEADGHRLRLRLSANGLDAVGLTYAGHAGAGAGVINPRGLGLMSFAGVPIDVPAPPTPQRVTARGVSCIQAELSWPPAPGARTYRIERDGAVVATVDAPSFRDVPLDPDTRYRYRVAAVNRGGASAFSPPAILRTPPIPGPPQPPQRVTATARSKSEIEIRWEAAPQAAMYLVRRNQDAPDVVYGTTYWDRGLEPGAVLHYQVAGAHPGATSSFSRATSITLAFENVFARVPESAEYQIVYDLHLPPELTLDESGQATYDRVVPLDRPFDRVAYYLELRRAPSEPMDWVFISMDAFTDDLQQIGIPTLASGAAFQQPVTQVHLVTSIRGERAERRIPEGVSIEFWGRTYSTGNAARVAGADPDRYDAGDEMNLAGVYGSMQVHLHGSRPAPVFAYNGWASPGEDDLGIGPAPTRHPDWTFAANAGSYTHRRLQVLARPRSAGEEGSLLP